MSVLHNFIQTYPLATLITAGPSGILTSLVPMTLHLEESENPEREKGTLRFHLARMNPQVERLKAQDEVLITFNGPQSYISPSYYPTKKVHGKVVPTWNYTVVQVAGQTTVVDDAQWILQQITALADLMETSRPLPWKVTDAPEEFISQLVKSIIGAEVKIEKLDGIFKVSQNQPDENRIGVEQGLTEKGDHALASLVKERSPSRSKN